MIRLMKSTFYHEKETKRKLTDFIMDAEILSMGKECQKAEEQFGKKQGRKFSLFVSSGSMANLVLIQALVNLGKLQKGDHLAVSSLTWSTNVMPIIQMGLVPIAIDCQIKTLNVSSRILREVNKKDNIRALFLTNVLGFADDINNIKDYCQEKNILFLEDNCESLGSKIDGKLLGNFGLASTFSSFVGHHFSTIEGGMICTDNQELYEMLLMVRAHGWDRNLSPEKQKILRLKNNIDDFFARYSFYDLAYNARPTEINGFLLNTQLPYWDEIVQKRESNFRRFQKSVISNDDFIPLDIGHMDIVSNFAMPLVCKNKESFTKYRGKFDKNKVEIRPIIAGDITKQPFYKKYIVGNQFCQNADFIHKNGFYFPNNPELTEADINLLVDLLKK